MQVGRLRERVAELERQMSALRFSSDQSDMVREQFADLYDYAPVGYLTVDAEGVIRRVNVPAAALLGGSRQDLPGRKLVALVRPGEKAAFTSFVKAAFTATSPIAIEVGLVRGKWRAESLQFVAAPAASGRDLGHPGAQARLAVLDVTDRKKAEEALRESRDRFQAVIASMAEGVVIHDATGAIRECNTAAQRILGLTEGELLGREPVDPRWRAIHEDGSPFPGAQHPAMEALRTGASRWNVTMGVDRPDGSRVWLNVNADPLRNGDGTVRGSVATFTDVTEERRRAAEQAEVLARLSFVIDGSDDGFWDWNVGTGAVKFSRRWAQMYGYDVGELEPSVAAWERMVHPDDRERAWAELRRHLDGETDQHVVEMRLRHRDGHWVRVVVRGKVVARDAEGKPLRMAGTATDVTERVEMEQALASSELRYRQLADGMRDGLLVQQDWKLVYANPAVARILGAAGPEAVLGPRSWEHVEPASLTRIEDATRRVLAGEVVPPFDVTLAGADGLAHVVEAQQSPTTFEGRPAIQVVLRDVTEQRKLREELERTGRLLRHHVENTPLGAIEWDGEFRMLRFSRRAEEIFGWKAEEVVGRRAEEIPWISQEDWPLVRAALDAMARGERPENVVTNRNRRKDGRIIRCEWSNSCTYDAQGKLSSVFSLVQDVTAQRARQAKLLASSKLEALGTLVSGMAHEINNPLAAAMANVGFAIGEVAAVRKELEQGRSRGGVQPMRRLEEAVEVLVEAREANQRVADIVRDLMRLGRHDRGRERLRVRELVDEALRWLSATQSARAAIRVADDGAPDVMGEASQILQVIVSLVTNACEAIPAGRRGVVTVRTGRGGDGVSRVEVEDDGEGMAPDVLERAFDPFFTTRGVGKGIGLGLSVAHAIATTHGGTLTATSQPGHGSTFRLELPVADPAP